MVYARLPDRDASTTYQGLRRVVNDSLRHRNSTLTGVASVWQPDHADELERRIVEDPDETKGMSFDDKLRVQLRGAERGVVLLAADLRYLHLLPIYDMSPELKRRRLDAILELSGHALSEDVVTTLGPGVVAWGAGHSQAWPQFSLLIRMSRWLSGLGGQELETVLSDPWVFKAGLFELDASSAQMEREALLHFVHPETFDAVFNQWHKNKIVDRWRQHAPDVTDRDHALLDIRAALSEEFGEGFNWYDDGIRELWDPSEAASPTPPGVPSAGATATPPDGSDRLAHAAADLHVPLDWLRKVHRLLRDKGQVVFYGPPGTGKTYIAQRLAEALAADESRRQLVQFHPSTSYEDFFEGYRPRIDDAGQMVYKLVPGPLARMAERAASDPDNDYLLIIDEINRANLPRVLGELLFLLEYRDRAITTLYRADEPFSLPSNLFFIGTMNTADRSIALIDAALRRRFHFVPMFPDVPPIDGLLERWIAATGGDPRWPRLLAVVNDWLRADLGGPDLQVGPSHFLDDTLDEEGARLAWQHSIYPYIEDQLFERPERLSRYRWENVVAALDEPSSETDGLS